MNFIENYPLEELRPADYNPRQISETAFVKLKESLKRFGIVKPIILNGNGVLTAGHQRTKAMKEIGITSCPAIMLKEVSRHDEIKFNLFHNSIETGKTSAKLLNPESVPEGYSFVNHGEYICEISKNGAVTKHIGDLYLRYGNWGSVVAASDGTILFNSDYISVMNIYKESILVYKLRAGEEDSLINYLSEDYGVYKYDALGIKPYVQLNCQMNRVKSDVQKGMKSTLYETIVIPEISKNHDKRIVDFGAGKFAYVRYLFSKGYKIYGYEPYFKQDNQTILIGEVLRQIDILKRELLKDGLFDYVVLDSVINSITSSNYERYVLTTCNALMKAEGTLLLATRALEFTQKRAVAVRSTQRARELEFLDEENFSATYRGGVWTMQKFHSVESLKLSLLRYFDEVKVWSESKSQNYAICRAPKQLSEEKYREALTEEFNMPYPNDYRHNKHKAIVEILLRKVRERGTNH